MNIFGTSLIENHNNISSLMNMYKINKKIFFAFASVIFTILIVLSLTIYVSEKQNLAKDKHADLKAIALLKSNQLSQWFNYRKTEAMYFSSNPYYTDYVKHLVSKKAFDSLSLRSTLNEIMNDQRYENIFIMDSTGKLIFSVDKSYSIDTTTFNTAIKAFKTRELIVNDFYFCHKHNKVHFDLVAPVIDHDDHKTLAVMVLRVDPNKFLYPLINQWPGTSRTAETVLARQDEKTVWFLNNLKHRTNSALQIKCDISENERPIVRAVLGDTGIFIGNDYSGNKVLSDLRNVPGTPWSMVVKIDMEEVYQSYDKKALLVFSLFILLLICLTTVIGWIYLRRTRNVYRELYEKSQDLFETQSKLGTTLYCIGDGVIATGPDGIITNMNPIAVELTGWTEEEAIGKIITDVFTIINEETRATVDSPVDKVIKEGKVVGLANHTLLISKDGRETPISDSGAPIRNEKGDFIGVVMVFTDQSEERLRQKLLQFRINIVEYAARHSIDETLVKMLDDVGRLTYSPHGYILFVSPDQKKVQFKAWTSQTTAQCKIHGMLPELEIENAGLWADCIREGKPVFHNSFDILKGEKRFPAGHIKVTRDLVVPVYRDNKITAVLGLGNKPTDYNHTDVEIVSFLADLMWEICEIKNKEALIKQNEERFFQLFDRAPMPYQSLDENGCITDVNEAWCDLLGYKKQEVTGKHFADFMVPHHAVNFDVTMSTFIKNGHLKSQFDIICKDGRILNIQHEGKIGYDSDGLFEKTHCILQDITEKNKIEKQLREHERQLTSMISHLPGFTYRCSNNPSWTMLYISEGCKSVTGYHPNKFLCAEISFNEIIAPAYKQKVYDYWQYSIKNKSFFEMEYPVIHKSGETRWLWERGKGVYDSDGNLIFLEGYIEDISDRKKAERELRESEERNRLIMDNSHDAILLTTSEGRVISANLAACILFGMTERELQLIDPRRLVDQHDDEFDELLNNRLRDKYLKGELIFIRKDGSKFPAEVTSSIFKNSKGELLSSMIIRDVTRRKRDEQIQQMLNDELMAAKIKAEESDRLKTAFLANMSHEIRTPMNGILGFLELLKEPDIEAESRNEYIELVNVSGIRLLNTINDIIEISKIESGELEAKEEEVNLTETFRFYLDFFKPQTSEKQIDLRIGSINLDNQITIISDRHKIDSILTNLIKNAIKFTKVGYVEFGYLFEVDSIILYVKDTGVGIHKNRIHAIFERFVQAELNFAREFEGTGLGLAIVKSYAESLNGTVWVESEFGSGSTFYVRIPYRPAANNHLKKIEFSNSVIRPYTGVTILVAEDDDISYRFIEKILTKVGIKLLHTVNGSDTVALVRENQNIELVLMDIKMPVMDGLHATREIRKFNKDIPIIAQTAYNFSGDDTKAIEAGCTDYISKPINKEKLFKILNKYLQISRSVVK